MVQICCSSSELLVEVAENFGGETEEGLESVLFSF